jgi:hypothetical protein
MKKWKIVQLFPNDTHEKFGLLKEDENGNIHYLHLNGTHRRKLVTYSASFEVLYAHLTRDQYSIIWNAYSDELPKLENISEVGTFADDYDYTEYSQIMNKLYK